MRFMAPKIIAAPITLKLWMSVAARAGESLKRDLPQLTVSQRYMPSPVKSENIFFFFKGGERERKGGQVVRWGEGEDAETESRHTERTNVVLIE